MSPNDPRHGEPRGYAAHLKDGEKPCEPCREAMNEKRRRWFIGADEAAWDGTYVFDPKRRVWVERDDEKIAREAEAERIRLRDEARARRRAALEAAGIFAPKTRRPPTPARERQVAA